MVCSRDYPFIDATTKAIEIVEATITFDPFNDVRLSASRSIYNDTLHVGIAASAFNTSTTAR